jgi:hypothetical protein
MLLWLKYYGYSFVTPLFSCHSRAFRNYWGGGGVPPILPSIRMLLWVYILYILIYFVLYLSLQESYTWSNINACVHNIIIGQMWIEQVTERFERISIGNVLPRGLVKGHLLLTLLVFLQLKIGVPWENLWCLVESNWKHSSHMRLRWNYNPTTGYCRKSILVHRDEKHMP